MFAQLLTSCYLWLNNCVSVEVTVCVIVNCFEILVYRNSCKSAPGASYITDLFWTWVFSKLISISMCKSLLLNINVKVDAKPLKQCTSVRLAFLFNTTVYLVDNCSCNIAFYFSLPYYLYINFFPIQEQPTVPTCILPGTRIDPPQLAMAREHIFLFLQRWLKQWLDWTWRCLLALESKVILVEWLTLGYHSWFYFYDCFKMCTSTSTIKVLESLELIKWMKINTWIKNFYFYSLYISYLRLHGNLLYTNVQWDARQLISGFNGYLTIHTSNFYNFKQFKTLLSISHQVALCENMLSLVHWCVMISSGRQLALRGVLLQRLDLSCIMAFNEEKKSEYWNRMCLGFC